MPCVEKGRGPGGSIAAGMQALCPAGCAGMTVKHQVDAPLGGDRLTGGGTAVRSRCPVADGSALSHRIWPVTAAVSANTAQDHLAEDGETTSSWPASESTCGASALSAATSDLTGTWAAMKVTCSYRQTSGCHPAGTEGGETIVSTCHTPGCRPRLRPVRTPARLLRRWLSAAPPGCPARFLCSSLCHLPPAAGAVANRPCQSAPPPPDSHFGGTYAIHMPQGPGICHGK